MEFSKLAYRCQKSLAPISEYDATHFITLKNFSKMSSTTHLPARSLEFWNIFVFFFCTSSKLIHRTYILSNSLMNMYFLVSITLLNANLASPSNREAWMYFNRYIDDFITCLSADGKNRSCLLWTMEVNCLFTDETAFWQLWLPLMYIWQCAVMHLCVLLLH